MKIEAMTNLRGACRQSSLLGFAQKVLNEDRSTETGLKVKR
jgi:hypothetical protein